MCTLAEISTYFLLILVYYFGVFFFFIENIGKMEGNKRKRKKNYLGRRDHKENKEERGKEEKEDIKKHKE